MGEQYRSGPGRSVREGHNNYIGLQSRRRTPAIGAMAPEDNNQSADEEYGHILWGKDLSDFTGAMGIAPSYFVEGDRSPTASGGGGRVTVSGGGRHSARRATTTNSPPSYTSLRPWTADSLAHYVCGELSSILGRLSRLEEAVQRLSQALLPRSGSLSPSGSNLEPHPPIPVASSRREITRSHLDRHCMPVIEVSPNPNAAAINRIAVDLEETYKTLDRKVIVSQIRRWFRKRREEMSTRIVNAFRRRHRLPREEDMEAWELLLRQLDREEINLAPIVNDARLEIADSVMARQFAKEKLVSFLKRRKIKE